MKGDVTVEDNLVYKTRIASFLKMLNCSFVNDGLPNSITNNSGKNGGNSPMRLGQGGGQDPAETYLTNLSNGVKSAVHPTIHWLLSNYTRLQKRAYLGRYLVRVEPPQEFQQDDVVRDLAQSLKDMQNEFKEVHKDYENKK